MNDRERKAVLTLASRLSNWQQRTRLDTATFLANNRQEFDRLVGPLVEYAQARRQWRTWDQVSERERERIKRYIRRYSKDEEGLLLPLLPLWEARFRLIHAAKDLTNLWIQARQWPWQSSVRHRLLAPKNAPIIHNTTPADRLFSTRCKELRNSLGLSTITPTFYIDLHPDDVTATWADGTLLVTADRYWRRGPRLTHYTVLAKQLYLTDELTKVEVWYAAYWFIGRNVERGELRRRYIARLNKLEANSSKHASSSQSGLFCTTNLHTTAESALKAGLKMYAEEMALRLAGD